MYKKLFSKWKYSKNFKWFQKIKILLFSFETYKIYLLLKYPHKTKWTIQYFPVSLLAIESISWEQKNGLKNWDKLVEEVLSTESKKSKFEKLWSLLLIYEGTAIKIICPSIYTVHAMKRLEMHRNTAYKRPKNFFLLSSSFGIRLWCKLHFIAISPVLLIFCIRTHCNATIVHAHMFEFQMSCSLQFI